MFRVFGLLLLCWFPSVWCGCLDPNPTSQDLPVTCLVGSGTTCYSYSIPDQLLSLVSNQPVAYKFIYTNGSTLTVDVIGGNATIIPNANNGTTGFIVNITAYPQTTTTLPPTTTQPTIGSSSSSTSTTSSNSTSTTSPPTTVAPTVPATMNSTSVTFTLRLNLDLATFNANFSLTFVASLAQALGCDVTRVHLKSVVAGSVIITVLIDAPPVTAPVTTATAQTLVQNFLTQLNTTGSALRNISGWGSAIDPTYISNISSTTETVPVPTTTATPTTTPTPTPNPGISSSTGNGKPNSAHGVSPHWATLTTVTSTATTTALYLMRNNHMHHAAPWLTGATVTVAAATLFPSFSSSSSFFGVDADAGASCPSLSPVLVTIYLPVYVDRFYQRRFSFDFTQAQIFNATCADPLAHPQLATPPQFHPKLGCTSFSSTFTLAWSSPTNPVNCSNAVPSRVTLQSNQFDVIVSSMSDSGIPFSRSDWFQQQPRRTWNTILPNGEIGTVTAWSSGNENQAKDATFVAVDITTPTITCHVAYSCAGGTCADASNTEASPLRCAEFSTLDNSTTCPRYNASSGPVLSNPYGACPSLTCLTWCPQSNNASSCSQSACPAGYGYVNAAANPPITSICDSTGLCRCPRPVFNSVNHTWNINRNVILLVALVSLLLALNM